MTDKIPPFSDAISNPEAVATRLKELNKKPAAQRRAGLKKLFLAIIDHSRGQASVGPQIQTVEKAAAMMDNATCKTFNQLVHLLSADLMRDVIKTVLVTGTNRLSAMTCLRDQLILMERALLNPDECVKASRKPYGPLIGYNRKIQQQATKLTTPSPKHLPDYNLCLTGRAGIIPTKGNPGTTKVDTDMSDDNTELGFGLDHMTTLALTLAYLRAKEDDIGFQHDGVEAIKAESEDAVRMIGEKFKLTAKQRLSLSSSVELTTSSNADPEGYDGGSAIHEILKKQGLLGEGAQTEEKTADTAVTVAEPVTVDANVRAAINTMVKHGLGDTATAEAGFTDIEETLTSIKQLRLNASAFEEEIKYLKGRTFTAPVQISGKAEVDGDTLTYEVVQRNAMKLFKNPRTGRAIKQLNFNIPTLVWKNDKGAVTQHPMVPMPVDHYQFRATHLIKFLTAFIMGKNVWCHGHTGTGKTTLPEQVAAVIQFPVFPINLDGNIERADLVGQMNIVNDGGTSITQFKEGILPRAMVQPCFLVLDEIDVGKPDVMFVIQRATEGKGLLLTEDGGRLVKPNPLFRFVATANSRGQGDEYGVYAGVRPMNGALLNRFPIFIEVDYMTKEEESAFLKKTYGIADEVIDNITTFAGMCRKAFSEGETTVPVSPRDTMAMCEMYNFFEGIFPTKAQAMEFAVTTSVIDRAPMDNRQRIVELADRCFASCKFTATIS